MNLRSMFGNVSIGKDTSGNYRLWPGGVAVRTSGSEYIGYDTAKGLIDVSGDVINDLDFIYKTPVSGKDLEDGDLLLVKDGATPDVLFIVKRPLAMGAAGDLSQPHAQAAPGHQWVVDFLNPRTFRSERYVPPKDPKGNPVYIRVFSPLTKMLSTNPLLHFMLAKGEGGHDSHALAALIYQDLDSAKLNDLTPVFVSEKGLSSELLSLKKLEKEVKPKP